MLLIIFIPVFFMKIIICDFIINSTNDCSPVCFCRSSLNRRFLAELSFSQCDDPPYYCHQNRFLPPSFHLTQFIPALSNLSHCQDDKHCLHALHSTQTCRRCQFIYNESNLIKPCFHFCEQISSCGIVCIQQPIVVSVICRLCQNPRQNISCRCVNPSSCLSSTYETTTARWMQKRGFPAAAILAVLILAVALLVIAIKLIYRQLDLMDRRHSLAVQQMSLLPRSFQPSPDHLDTSPRLVQSHSQQLVVEIHRCKEENDLSILLVEKKSSEN